MSKVIPVHVSGLAHLCFLPNGRFTGRVVGANSQFSIVGGPDYCLGPHEHSDHHQCCYDESCKFRDLTVMDYDGYGKSTLVPRVLQSGGDNCNLSSPNVKFITDQLITGDKAEEFIDKYFPPELKGRGCYLCVGDMQISFPEPLAGEATESAAKEQPTENTAEEQATENTAEEQVTEIADKDQ